MGCKASFGLYGLARLARIDPQLLCRVKHRSARAHANLTVIITYLRHRVTNAASESIKAKIQWVKYTARGFRNKKNFAAAILFHCGGPDLVP